MTESVGPSPTDGYSWAVLLDANPGSHVIGEIPGSYGAFKTIGFADFSGDGDADRKAGKRPECGSANA